MATTVASTYPETMMRQPTTSMKAVARLMVAFVAIISASVLAGCARPDVRSATGDQAGNLGSQVCITNNSGSALNVAFTTFDSKRGDGALAPGGEACGEGTTFWGEDVRGSITSPSGTVYGFWASNQWVGAPWFQVANVRTGGGICPGEGWDVGDSDSMQTVSLDWSVTRQGDDSQPGGSWKNFSVVITDGTGYQVPYQYCNKV